jgi:Protein of unknown function (DUF2510)
MTQPTAGWYPHPHGQPAEMYWSGSEWTGHTRPIAPPPAAATAPYPPNPYAASTPQPHSTGPTNPASWAANAFPPPAGARPLKPPPPLAKPRKQWYQRRGFLITAGILAALLVIGGIGSALSPKTTAKNATGGTGGKVAATAPSAATAPTKSASPAAGDDANTDNRGGGAAAEDGFTMPDEVGQVLQDAQDDLQRISGDPVYFSDSHDASGQDRMQILDRDWQVCSQNVPAGKRVTDTTTVDFSVVKMWESCP